MFMPSKSVGRIGLFVLCITITAATVNAAGFSFVDSIKEFFGLAPVATTTASVQPMAPLTNLLTDDFSYTAGQLITANGWTAHSGGGTNAITVTSGGLTATRRAIMPIGRPTVTGIGGGYRYSDGAGSTTSPGAGHVTTTAAGIIIRFIIGFGSLGVSGRPRGSPGGSAALT